MYDITNLLLVGDGCLRNLMTKIIWHLHFSGGRGDAVDFAAYIPIYFTAFFGG
jgi:hypothetical protein